FDVLYTSLNNLETHRTEIELTQRTLTTLPKDPEGQEVLSFFDIQEWQDYREGDFHGARQYFADFTRFLDQTPAILKILRDPKAPIDRKTYDCYGDEKTKAQFTTLRNGSNQQGNGESKSAP